MASQSWWQTFSFSQADGPTLVTAAQASLLNPQSRQTFVAGYWNTIGEQLKVEAWGRISSVITTPGTARFFVMLGAVAVFDGLAILLDTVAAHTTVGWKFEALLTLEVVGSSAKFFGQGLWTCEDILGTPASSPKAAVTAVLPWASAPAQGASFDATASQQFDLQFLQTVGTGSITCHQLNVSVLN